MTKSIRYILTSLFIFNLLSCSPKEEVKVEVLPLKTELPSGIYKLDKSHGSLIFKVNHLGLSNYSMQFKRFDAELKFDNINPTLSNIAATIDPTSIETNYPDISKVDFNAELQNEKWLDVIKFPKITFTSNKIELTSETTARITGDLDLHGIVFPVVLDATFNGGYNSNPMDPSGSRIGFSAHGSLKRSDFGISFGIPENGSKMGVGDDVEFIIEAEFTKPLQDVAE